MDLSIVIPALNEDSKIRHDVEAAAAFLLESGLNGEVIVVDDGSSDRTSAEAEAADVPATIRREVVRNERQRGKGHAIRTGMGHTSGQYVMFADSGSTVRYADARRGLDLLRQGACDVAVGSRKTTGSVIRVPHRFSRRVLSALFSWLVPRLMGVPPDLRDTQCGFKLYRGDVGRKLFAQCVTDGFMFDIELIVRATRQGYKVREFPIEWSCDRDTRLRPGGEFLQILRQLLKIRIALARERRSGAVDGN